MKRVTAIMLVGAFAVGTVISGYVRENINTHNSVRAEETAEVKVINRGSWDSHCRVGSNTSGDTGYPIEFNYQVYSDDSVYIECNNPVIHYTASTITVGELYFDDSYYNIDITPTAKLDSDGAVTYTKRYIDNNVISYSFKVTAITGFHFEYTVGSTFNVHLTPKENAVGDPTIIAFDKEIVPSEAVEDTSVFDINKDDKVDVLDLMRLKSYLLNRIEDC